MASDQTILDIGLWSAFARKIMAVLVAAGLLVGGLLTSVSIWEQKNLVHDFLGLRGRTLARSLGRAAFVPLVLEDKAALDVLTEGFKGEIYVAYVALYSPQGRVLSQKPADAALPLDSPPEEMLERRMEV